MIRKMPLAFSALVAALVMSVVVVGPASAHSDTFQSVPENGSTVTTPVVELQFTFVEAVELSFPPEVILNSSEGAGIELGAPTFDASGATMTVPINLGELPNGTYTAAYRIVSVDGHPASGEVTFTVEDSSAEPLVFVPLEEEPVVTEVTDDMLRTTTAAETTSTVEWVFGGLAAAAVVLAGVLVLVAVRRRRNAGSK
ncbi:MYXO-CTERM domain-containing protein [Aurantimicrobium minutum]|uniref:copper resistance CopC family protein n=1 Tax=Aurantimicrobium minutum TaxID=708131 RepID=UPI0024762A8B|nr:copper resistance protein CopC [Aurantimicrobium minutum]MDH6531868.1 MYXO-CTERM domain-containing protein [Aurantimicrobium minutum]